MHIEEPDLLKEWLVDFLKPLCEADPEALAKYVMALIKKPNKSESELKKICLDQLDVFLSSNTEKFVDQLFVSLGDKSYKKMNKKSASPQPLSKANDNSKTEERPTSTTTTTTNKDDDRDRHQRTRSKSTSRSPPPSSGSRSRRIDRSAVNRRGDRSPHSRSPSPPRRRRISRSPTPPTRRRREGGIKRDRSPSRSPSPRRRPRTRSRTRSPVAPRGSRSPPPTVTREKRKRTPTSPNHPRESIIPPQPPTKKRERCRNYHEKGVCLDGDMCPFDHGSDPVVLNAFGLPTPASTAAAPPPPSTPAQLLTPSRPLPPPPPQAQQQWPEYDPGNPSIHPTVAPQQQQQWVPTGNWTPRGPIPQQQRPPVMPIGAGQPRPNLNLIVPETSTQLQQPPQMSSTVKIVPTVQQHHQQQMPQHYHPQQQQHQMQHMNRVKGNRGFGRGGRRGRGGFGGRGGGSNVRQFDPQEKTTLEIRRLPPNLNNITTLNEYFSRFGTIVNLQVQYSGDPEAAVVQFAAHNEAVKAHRCEEAVLGNRFIKLFWHNKEQEKVDPISQRETNEPDSSEQSAKALDGTAQPQEEDNRPSVKDRLELPKPLVMNEGEPGHLSKPSKPVMNPKLLKKSNIDKEQQPPKPAAPTVIEKLPSEKRKEKIQKNCELQKKLETYTNKSKTI